MKHLIILLFIALLPLTADAQMRFGYLSYDQTVKAMPDYAVAQKNLEQLKAQYDNETKRAEDEFNAKYKDFLEGQRELAPSILKKRQAELQELLDRNIAFKKDADRLLKQAENDMLKPVKDKLAALLKKIGEEKGLAFILNTDGDSLPFVNAAYGEDVTEAVKAAISN